jgi:ABC-type branched-subunit amino acid transport system permease subunit
MLVEREKINVRRALGISTGDPAFAQTLDLQRVGIHFMPLTELLIGGILLGGVYALMACGLNLIFGVMRVINFAHGDILAVAALSTVSIVVGFKLPFWLAVVLVPIRCALLGILIHMLILRRIESAPMIMSLLATYALSTILVNVAILIWGGGYSGLPGVLGGSIRLLGANVSISRLVSFVCAIGVSLAVWWLLQFTRFGAFPASRSSGFGSRHSRLVPAWQGLPACWSRPRSPLIPNSARASSSRRLR